MYKFNEEDREKEVIFKLRGVCNQPNQLRVAATTRAHEILPS